LSTFLANRFIDKKPFPLLVNRVFPTQSIFSRLWIVSNDGCMWQKFQQPRDFIFVPHQLRKLMKIVGPPPSLSGHPPCARKSLLFGGAIEVRYGWFHN
jgi:hypothetical protein